MDPVICSEVNQRTCYSLYSEHRNLPYHADAISVFVFQKLKHTESDKLQVQIQAYLDNVFDVGALLEDAETKNAALERVEELEENLSHVSVSASDWKNSLNSLISSLSLRINVQQIRMLMVDMPVPVLLMYMHPHHPAVTLMQMKLDLNGP